MKLEDQVISLELAKKMKELGFERNSHFYWCEHWGEYTLGSIKDYVTDGLPCNGEKDIPAYTVAELVCMLTKLGNNDKIDMAEITANKLADKLIYEKIYEKSTKKN